MLAAQLAVPGLPPVTAIDVDELVPSPRRGSWR